MRDDASVSFTVRSRKPFLNRPVSKHSGKIQVKPKITRNLGWLLSVSTEVANSSPFIRLSKVISLPN